MNVNVTGVEDRVLERIRKLLRLANDDRGNEYEAALAARRATELMEEHGLSTAIIEAGGGIAEGRTVKEEGGIARGRAPWMPELMRVVAESCFCLCEVEFMTPQGDTQLRMLFRLFGRESAVAGAYALADYLKQTIWRLSKDAKRPHYFRSGCAERLGERVREGHEMALANQRAEAERAARETAARASHPGAAPTSTALVVVVLADYAQSEKDGNEDLRRGLPAGTTAAKRAAENAEKVAKAAKYQELIAAGVESGVAWNVVYLNMTMKHAIEYEEEYRAERARRVEAEPKHKRTRADERRDDAAWRRSLRDADKRSDPSWIAGRERGDEVSLSRQIDDGKRRKLS